MNLRANEPLLGLGSSVFQAYSIMRENCTKPEEVKLSRTWHPRQAAKYPFPQALPAGTCALGSFSISSGHQIYKGNITQGSCIQYVSMHYSRNKGAFTKQKIFSLYVALQQSRQVPFIPGGTR